MSKNVKLNNNEMVLLQYCIDKTEALQVIIHEPFFSKEVLEELNMTFKQIEGVFGSLCKKGLFTAGQPNINGWGSWGSMEWFIQDELIIGDYGSGKLKTAQQVLDYFNQYEGE